MSFLTTAITSRFPTTNNQLRTSSNLKNQATIQDGRVTVQQVQGRQGQGFAGMRSKSSAKSLVININGGNNAAFQARVVMCYNCQGEGHMARQCTQPKRHKNLAWFNEKILLVQAQEAGQELDEEELAFLADLGVAESQDTQTTIIHNAAFQTDDLNAFDSDCDEEPGAKAVLMANLSSYDLTVISEVPISETNQDNSVLDNCVQEIVVVQNTASTEQQNAVIMSVFEEITNRVAKCNAENIQNKNVNESLTAELERYKERVQIFEESQKVDLNDHEKYIESQMNYMILNKNAKESFKDFDNGLHDELNEVKTVLNEMEAAIE
ncbi:putative reverse transcriptase domain-containing protein [Tanacetum coccineum]